jgi:hypothetical protein
MSTNLKNPNDQDDHKKGMLSNQPRLTRVKPTVLLGSREQQPIENMMSLRTDFEMHAYGQGYGEEVMRSVNRVTNLFWDEDLDVGHHKVTAPVAKEYVARKKPLGNREPSQAQERQLVVITMTDKLDKPQVEAEAMASRAHELTGTIAPGETQETYWDRIKCKKRFGNPRGSVKRKATINPDSQI